MNAKEPQPDRFQALFSILERKVETPQRNPEFQALYDIAAIKGEDEYLAAQARHNAWLEGRAGEGLPQVQIDDLVRAGVGCDQGMEEWLPEPGMVVSARGQ